MKQYIPHLFIVIGALVFVYGAVIFVYATSLAAGLLPLIGIGVAVFGLRQLRSRSISN